MKNNIRIIYLAGFLFTIPLALTSYINSSFLEQYITKDYVGLIYVFASILTIICMLEMPRMLNRFGVRKNTITWSSLSFFALIILAFSKSSVLLIPAFVLYFMTNFFLIANLDIFFEDISIKKNVGKLRGLYLSITSMSWVLAQMISGSIIAKSGFLGIYLFASLFIILVGGLFITNLHTFKDPKYKKVAIKKTLITFWNNKNILNIYLINLILKFFYSWMIIYMSIYLHEIMQFSWTQIGAMYAFMLTPFVFLSYPLGKLSDKIGEKKMLIYGFIFIALATIIIPLIKESVVWVFALILFISRIGAATIEVMSESYFFKNINQEDIDEISFFRNTGPLSFIIGPALATIFLLYIPNFSYLFFILSAILMFGILLSSKLEDIK